MIAAGVNPISKRWCRRLHSARPPRRRLPGAPVLEVRLRRKHKYKSPAESFSLTQSRIRAASARPMPCHGRCKHEATRFRAPSVVGCELGVHSDTKQIPFFQLQRCLSSSPRNHRAVRDVDCDHQGQGRHGKVSFRVQTCRKGKGGTAKSTVAVPEGICNVAIMAIAVREIVLVRCHELKSIAFSPPPISTFCPATELCVPRQQDGTCYSVRVVTDSRFWQLHRDREDLHVLEDDGRAGPGLAGSNGTACDRWPFRLTRASSRRRLRD